MLGTVNILLRGLPFIYQGQEIGMQNAVWNSLDEFNDINTIDQYHLAKDAGLTDKDALKVCEKMSRDNARTPMQWSSGENAGFTTGTPWLKVNDNYPEINVLRQDKDRDSVLNYYRRLLKTRKSPEYKEVFTYGEFIPAYEDTETIMSYYRQTEHQKILIAANFGKEPVCLNLETPIRRVILSNQKNLPKPEQFLKLESCEVIVAECVED